MNKSTNLKNKIIITNVIHYIKIITLSHRHKHKWGKKSQKSIREVFKPLINDVIVRAD